MNMFEEAENIRASLALRDMTQKKLGSLMGVSQPYIANKVRLLDFSPEARRLITDTGLSERHARTILRLSDECDRLYAIDRAARGKMSVAQCEIMVDCMLDEKKHGESDAPTPLGQLSHFEKGLESSVSLLRRFGFYARVKREKHEDILYYTITVK